MDTIKDDYVIHKEFQDSIKDLKSDMYTMELRLGKQLCEKIYHTYLEFIPIVLTILGLQTAMIYFVIKAMVE